MFTTQVASSAIYGLTAKARCITSQIAETEKNRFLVGTLSLRDDNEIHLIEVREDGGDITCVNIFNHPCEIWAISACPSNPALLFTCYNTGTEYKATLWRMNENRSNVKLDEVLELRGHTGVIKGVLWDPSGSSDYVVSLDEGNIRVFDLENNFTNPKAAQNIAVSGKINAGNIDPLHNNMMAVAVDTTIIGYDFRTQKEGYSIDKAHNEGVRDIDFNPNKAYYMVSGGDDAKLKFWDVRNTKGPVKVLSGHSHWIWAVRYNRYHDQLVVTASSDHLVKLWNVESISSARDAEEEEATNKKKKAGRYSY